MTTPQHKAEREAWATFKAAALALIATLRIREPSTRCGGTTVQSGTETWEVEFERRAESEPARNDCNRHADCAAADAAAKAKGRVVDHCHDECCEDCFGN